MKIMCVGDTHSRTKFLSEYRKISESIISIAEKEKPSIIVMLGDDLHNHATAHSSQMESVVFLLTELAKIGKVFKLIGNHEMVSPSSFLEKDHHFHAMEFHPNIEIVDTPVVEQGMLFCPYVPVGRFREAIQGIELNDVRVCFAHQEFRGVRFAGSMSTSGDTWGANEPLMVSGHIHEKQMVQTNLVYPGSPSQITFADPLDKSVAIIEDDLSIRHVPTDFVRYVTHRISAGDKVEYDKSERNRVVVSGTLPELKAFRSSSFAKKLVRDGVQIQPLVVRQDVEAVEKNKKTFSECIESMLDDDIKELWESVK